MLRFHHFFEGMLKKEEAASAFLAMALEGLPSFRHHFFSALGIADERLGHLHAQTWDTPVVEKDRIDVRLASSTHVVLIENKIRSSAKQQDQLARYYRRERKRHECIIVAVYLAPGTTGTDEVEAVQATKEFRSHPDDLVLHVSWDKITAYHPHDPDAYESLVQSGLDAIKEAIRKAEEPGPFKNVGERREVRTLFGLVEQRVSARLKPVELDDWHDRNELIRTKATTVTVKIKTALGSGSRDNPTVVGVVTDGHFRLPMVATFRISTGVKKQSPAGKWWRRDMQRPEVDLPGVGTFFRDASGYYERRFEVEGTQATVAVQIADIVVGLAEAVQAILTQQGYPLLLDDLPEQWRRKNKRRGKQEAGDVR